MKEVGADFAPTLPSALVKGVGADFAPTLPSALVKGVGADFTPTLPSAQVKGVGADFAPNPVWGLSAQAPSHAARLCGIETARVFGAIGACHPSRD